jgi:hypothetical protein
MVLYALTSNIYKYHQKKSIIGCSLVSNGLSPGAQFTFARALLKDRVQLLNMPVSMK